ncbi:MAG: ATP-binding protein [Bacteroidota bacterium]
MVNKENLKKIIIENREFTGAVQVKQRRIELEDHSNYIFIGQRRSGKTYFLYQLIKKQSETSDNYLFINFEDERLMEFTLEDFDTLLDMWYQLFNTKPVVYFDEIQNIEGWEKFCRRLADQGYRIYITGSNARMLSSEMASTLGGRFLTKEIYPLSFGEYLEFSGIDLKDHFAYSNQKNEIVRIQDEYMHYGGLPETLRFQQKREYLSNIYQKVFFGDILVRYKIKNDFALKLLIKKMAESVNNETSFNRIKNLLQSAGVKAGTATLIEYFKYLEESFLIFSLTGFTSKFAEKEMKKKFYFGDTGILNLFLFDQKTKLFENMIFTELRRRFNKPIFYFKRNLETDFYIPEEKMLIQASYSLSDMETRHREINALISSMKELSIQNAFIITFDDDELIKKGDFTLKIIPYWKWVL